MSIDDDTSRTRDKPSALQVDMTVVRSKAGALVLRNALYAAVFRLLFGVSKSLLKGGLSSRSVSMMLEEVLSTNTLKWGLLGGGISCFRLLQQLALRYVPQIPAAYTSLAAGCLSSLSVMTFNRATRTEIALYLAVRAAHGFICANVWERLPEPVRTFQHSDVVVMCATAGQILYCLVFQQNAHLSSYLNFLVGSTMTDNRVLAAQAGVHRGHVVPEMVQYASQHNLPTPTDPRDMAQLCTYWHPGCGCNRSIFHFIVKHMSRFSLRVYLPLKVITTLVFGMKELKARPLEVAVKATKSVVCSSLFLTLYCATALRVMCAFNQWNVPSGIAVAVVVSSSGLSTFLEPKSRRLDLAMYCSMHALRSCILVLYYRGYISLPSRRHIVVLHTMTMGYILHQLDNEPDVLHRHLRSFLSFLLQEQHGSERSQRGVSFGKQIVARESHREVPIEAPAATAL